MRKKLYFQRCVKLLCLLLAVVLLSSLCACACSEHSVYYNKIIMSGFYAEPKNTLDVVLLGASDVFTGFSSAYAYDLYGFTSYPFALDANAAAMYPSQLREILKRQNPQWVVVEINGLLYDNPENHTEEAALRRYLDNIPLSLNKIDTILKNVPREEWISYLFPLAKYHSNWEIMLDQLDIIQSVWKICLRGNSLLRGLVTQSAIAALPERKEIAGNYATEPLTPQPEQRLRSLLQFCRDNQLENVLFVRFPHAVCSDWSYDRFRKCNAAEQIIRESGFEFLNLERDYEGIGLDFSTDFYNEDHLNAYGQKKLTEYLCGILTETYGVHPGALTQRQQESWDTSAEYIRIFYDYYDEQIRQGINDTDWETCALIEELESRRNRP